MSLVRLLTAGKSLVGSKDPQSRFRMRKKNLLPKFGAKNPFLADESCAAVGPQPETRRQASAPQEPAAEPEGQSPEPARGVLAANPPQLARYSSRLQTAEAPGRADLLVGAEATPHAPAPAPARESETVEVCQTPGALNPASASGQTEPRRLANRRSVSLKWAPELGRRLRKLSPFAWWSNRRLASAHRLVKPGRAPVQGELSLDNIKVVRNDLSDADVEIVPAKSAVAASAAVSVERPASAGGNPPAAGAAPDGDCVAADSHSRT